MAETILLLLCGVIVSTVSTGADITLVEKADYSHLIHFDANLFTEYGGKIIAAKWKDTSLVVIGENDTVLHTDQSEEKILGIAAHEDVGILMLTSPPGEKYLCYLRYYKNTDFAAFKEEDVSHYCDPSASYLSIVTLYDGNILVYVTAKDHDVSMSRRFRFDKKRNQLQRSDIPKYRLTKQFVMRWPSLFAAVDRNKRDIEELSFAMTRSTESMKLYALRFGRPLSVINVHKFVVGSNMHTATCNGIATKSVGEGESYSVLVAINDGQPTGGESVVLSVPFTVTGGFLKPRVVLQETGTIMQLHALKDDRLVVSLRKDDHLVHHVKTFQITTTA